MIDVAVRPASNMAPQDAQNAVEVVERRRQNGKTYDLGNGIHRTSTKLGAIHYKNDYSNRDEQWSEIDLTVDASNQVSGAPYNIEIFTDRVGYLYQSKQSGQVTVELVEIDGSPVDNNRFAVRRKDNQVFWDNVAQDVDMKIQLRPLSAEIFKNVKTATAARRFKWRVQESKASGPKFRRFTAGADASSDNLEIQTSVVPFGTSPTLDQFDYTETWTGRVSRIINPVTRQKGWFSDPVYPVIIDATTSENIIADVDDGFENTNTALWYSNYNNTIWFWGRYGTGGGSAALHGGTRFQTLGVPQGATINTATITLNVTAITGVSPANVYADDVDDAPAWSNNSRPSQITQTTASTALSITATGVYTVNVTSIVQEIISRPAWSSGNDIRFGFIQSGAPGTLNRFLTVYDYAQGQPNAAQLDVDYTPAAAGRTPRYGFVNFQTPGIV